MDESDILISMWPFTESFISNLGDEHPMKHLRPDQHSNIATFFSQMEHAFQMVQRDSENSSWFEGKLGAVKKAKDTKTVSSILGELRAYGILKNSFFGNQLVAQSGPGCDFISKLEYVKRNPTVRIEVNTPLGRDDRNRTTIDHGTDQVAPTTQVSVVENAPFGFPERKIDTMQSESISKIASIKGDERQFENGSINLLFVDFVNPFFGAGLDMIGDQDQPFILWQEAFTCGALWHAFYARRRDQIFEELRRFGSMRNYRMEYDGRFWINGGLLNLVLFNTFGRITAFDAIHRRSPSEIYSYLFSLSRFSFDHSWLNWPRSDLRKRVNATRKLGRKLLHAYRQDA